MVKQIQSTSNNEELSKMKSSNIQSMQDWMDFLKEKKSARFKAVSAKFKSMKKRQFPHTCSCKGYVRLAEDMGNGSDQFSNATNDQVVNNVATNPIGTSPPSINNNNTLRKCTLLDWGGTGEVVAEGRWSLNDPNVTFHHVPLDPHAVRVWVDLPKKSDAFLWRPNSEMTDIEDAVGSTVA
ncbi:uncharacterized protein E5676_scaffold16G00080 [Cucumis melo var. makuwa]|uniref:Plant transposase n=1 Tax=Cucumis melo var. makuwa TaxID=1194695 RepID=A0A5D3CF98_CUCMM|nr:uncharacterized protein E6C27_scaffold181G00090 [Cucumis melo var. makuwa]TYK09898.1 uncharacterized protein E5676_scaffold16G00080 [Cucumis melo var. makuwa]